jgi:hypothetical protein
MPRTEVQTRDATNALAYRAAQAGFEAVFPDADTPCDRCDHPLGSAIYRVSGAHIDGEPETRYICAECWSDLTAWWLYVPGELAGTVTQPEPIHYLPQQPEAPQPRGPKHQ